MGFVVGEVHTEVSQEREDEMAEQTAWEKVQAEIARKATVKAAREANGK